MNEVFVFLLMALLSFVGSIQPGPVNLGVVYYALHNKLKQAIYLSIGGSLPEVVYCFIAFQFHAWLQSKLPQLTQVLFWFNPLLILLGIYLLLKKDSGATPVETTRYGFGKGLLLGMLNPQLLLFWLGMATLSSQYPHYIRLETQTHYLFAALGAGLGAFLLHLSFIGIISKIHHANWVHKLKRQSVRLLGLLLTLIGLLGILHASFHRQI